jgi:hypothetical protein
MMTSAWFIDVIVDEIAKLRLCQKQTKAPDSLSLSVCYICNDQMLETISSQLAHPGDF